MVEPGIKGGDGTVNELIQSTSASSSNSNDSNTTNKSTSNNISKSSPAGVSIILFKKEFINKSSINSVLFFYIRNLYKFYIFIDLFILLTDLNHRKALILNNFALIPVS